MDIFIEQIVKKKTGTKDYLVFIAAFLGGFILIIASMALVPSISIFIIGGVCVGAYYLITSRNLEYEYSVTNGEVTIDKIINRRKRKRVISIEAHDIEVLEKYKPEEQSAKKYSERLFVSESDDGKDAWSFVTRLPQKGNVLVVFSANEKTLLAMKPFLTRQVAINAFGRN